MILAAIVGLLVTVGVLAVTSGVDSRDTCASEEHMMASRGMTWRIDRDHDDELARELTEALARNGSHHLELSQFGDAGRSQDDHTSTQAA
jgi:hypothetical protein